MVLFSKKKEKFTTLLPIRLKRLYPTINEFWNYHIPHFYVSPIFRQTSTPHDRLVGRPRFLIFRNYTSQTTMDTTFIRAVPVKGRWSFRRTVVPNPPLPYQDSQSEPVTRYTLTRHPIDQTKIHDTTSSSSTLSTVKGTRVVYRLQ